MEHAAGLKPEVIHAEPILYISCGIPGSGKSTFLKKHFGPDELIVSRDDIRFQVLGEDEEYFSHENEVFDTFVDDIIYWMKMGNNVYADATHLNKRSRDKLISAIDTHEPGLLSHIEAIFFDVPVNISNLSLTIFKAVSISILFTFLPCNSLHFFKREIALETLKSSIKSSISCFSLSS